MELRAVNQNLIPILRALLREQSVSRAAERLGLMQPAVSAALGNLRALLGDPLLVRRGNRMELTPRARELIGPTEQACNALDSVWRSASFDPYSAERRFTIANSDYGPLLIAPGLVSALAMFSPAIGIRFTDMAPQQVHAVRHGDIDGAILPSMYVEQFGEPELCSNVLFADVFLAVVGKGHRLSGHRQATIEDVSSERHVVFSPGVWSTKLGAFPSADIGMKCRPTAQVHNFGALSLIAAQTDCVAIMPSRIARQMERYLGLTLLYQTAGPPVEMALVWSQLHEFDPAHSWFRKLLASVLAKDAGDPATACAD